MLPLVCAPPAQSLAIGSEVAASVYCAVTVGTVADADVVQFCLVGAAHDLAGHFPVLAANTAGSCVGVASWYRALFLLFTPVLRAVPLH